MLHSTCKIVVEFGLLHKAFLSVKSASSPDLKQAIKNILYLKTSMNKTNTKRDIIYPPPPPHFKSSILNPHFLPQKYHPSAGFGKPA